MVRRLALRVSYPERSMHACTHSGLTLRKHTHRSYPERSTHTHTSYRERNTHIQTSLTLRKGIMHPVGSDIGGSVVEDHVHLPGLELLFQSLCRMSGTGDKCMRDRGQVHEGTGDKCIRGVHKVTGGQVHGGQVHEGTGDKYMMDGGQVHEGTGEPLVSRACPQSSHSIQCKDSQTAAQ